ncbi:Muconate cycloisomerase 1 [Halalkalibacter krulwichiae]|uniref:Muconate cycloisomerase 1 n=2 Tax=Halalkalibacter krulwichiae TaxID=199441 RepID=A0A1X9MKU6_9BACI|nr:muconate/chloromuconate family cycloisomerase [Halalkalibacter krulwichiae]ARK31312.1 Muconate cycloisomerase 1 [Halalkalibacter krulwichiae]
MIATGLLAGPTAVSTDMIDIPLKRMHQFSAAKMNAKPFLLIQIDTTEGVTGIGEGTTPGIWWGGESVETMKLVIEHYFTPLLIGEDPHQIEKLLVKLDRHVLGNEFAKATVEMALYDIVGKLANVPVSHFFGGVVHDGIPVRWALAAGSIEADIQEGREKVERLEHHNFKMKAGTIPTEEDIKRVIDVSTGLNGLTTTGVDPNGSWDELTTLRWMDCLHEANVDFLEQPLPKWDFVGLSRLKSTGKVPIMADESASTIQDALTLAKMNAVDIFSLKIHKSGGMSRVKKIAAIAEAAGIPCFGGTSLESSIGTAACLHVYSTLPNLTEGCELFGPVWLADDIVKDPVVFKNEKVYVPNKPGLGVTLDLDKVDKYRRKTR